MNNYSKAHELEDVCNQILNSLSLHFLIFPLLQLLMVKPQFQNLFFFLLYMRMFLHAIENKSMEWEFACHLQ